MPRLTLEVCAICAATLSHGKPVAVTVVRFDGVPRCEHANSLRRTPMRDEAFDHLSTWAAVELGDDVREKKVSEIVDLWETGDDADRQRYFDHGWEHMLSLTYTRSR